jgi:hypothetical protein
MFYLLSENWVISDDSSKEENYFDEFKILKMKMKRISLFIALLIGLLNVNVQTTDNTGYTENPFVAGYFADPCIIFGMMTAKLIWLAAIWDLNGIAICFK